MTSDQKKINIKNCLKVAGITMSIFIFAFSAIVWAFSPTKNVAPSEYNIVITYESAMQDKKPFIALFYTDWCTYCKRFMPTYETMAHIYKNRYNFVAINVENPTYEAVVRDYAIGGFPTIYIIDPTIDNRILINNTLYDDLSKLRVELDRYLRIRAMIKG